MVDVMLWERLLFDINQSGTKWEEKIHPIYRFRTTFTGFRFGKFTRKINRFVFLFFVFFCKSQNSQRSIQLKLIRCMKWKPKNSSKHKTADATAPGTMSVILLFYLHSSTFLSFYAHLCVYVFMVLFHFMFIASHRIVK